METPYDEVLEVKHGTTRKEKKLTVMAMLHAVPKKIADVSQTQGVSEKFLESGLPSGVINPSMLSHDRFLSATDAIQDAAVMAMMICLLPLFPVNGVTIGIFTLIMLYWFFHIGWWEKSKIWKIKSSVTRYLNNTYRIYWIMFYLFMLPVAFGLWFFVFQLGAEVATFAYINYFLEFVSGVEHAIATVFDRVEFIRNNLSQNIQYSIKIDAAAYETSFSIIAAIFFSTTIFAQILFRALYRKEREENIEHSSSELKYAGEAALGNLHKARNV